MHIVININLYSTALRDPGIIPKNVFFFSMNWKKIYSQNLGYNNDLILQNIPARDKLNSILKEKDEEMPPSTKPRFNDLIIKGHFLRMKFCKTCKKTIVY